MDDDDANQEGAADEYSSARKLVQRAADREALLKSFKVGGGGPGDDASDGNLASSGSAVPSSSSDAKSSSAGDAPSSSSSSALGSDFSNMPLKRDHPSRPCWTCPDGTIYLEAFHPLYATAYDFLVAIAEPVTRPEYVHEYKLTPYSLYAAVATNIDTESIVRVLQRYSKNALPESVAGFVRECTKRYGKAKLVLKHNRYHVESDHPSVLRELLRDDLISQARVVEVDGPAADGDAGGKAGDGGQHQRRGGRAKDTDGFAVNAKAEEMEENLRMLKEMDGDDDDDDEDDDDDDGGENDDDGDGEGGEGGRGGRSSSAKGGGRRNEPKTTVSFQIKAEDVEIVKRRAIE